MLTLNSILREIKNVPVDRLEELYQLVHAFTPEQKNTETVRKKILSFGGAFNDMTDSDYTEYLSHTQEVRASLVNRNIDF